MDNNEVISWFGGEFYFDFHIRRLRQLPLDDFFAEYKDRDRLRILEVGCCEGQSTLWWLKMYLNGNNSSITCIDPYTARWYDNPLNEIRLPTTKSTFEVFKSNILDKYDKDKVIFYKNNSAQVLPVLKGPYDIIYIDGGHQEGNVYYDALLSWPLLESGCTIMFDDYGTDEWTSEGYGPVHRALNRFLTADKLAEVDVVNDRRMLVLRKK